MINRGSTAQIWRSWTFFTPGIASMVAATCEALIFGGVDSNKTSSDSLNSGQAPFAIATTTSKLTRRIENGPSGE